MHIDEAVMEREVDYRVRDGRRVATCGATRHHVNSRSNAPLDVWHQ